MDIKPARPVLALILLNLLSGMAWAQGLVAPRIPVVEMRGSDTELGAAHGGALGAQVRLLQEQYLRVYLRTDEIRNASIAAVKLFEPIIAPTHMAEIRSLASASGMDVDSILLAQAFLDLRGSVACSTITLPAGASPDGVARFGRNLDFPGLKVAENNSVLLIFHPKDRYAFAAISWPGLIGVLSGMNEHGLSLANMEVPRNPRKPSGMPYTLLYRTVLEKCKTVNEAIALLQTTPIQSANNIMLMDASGDRAAIELAPDKITVRRASDTQPLISTNHQRGQDITTLGRCPRYDRLLGESGATFGKIDEPSIEAMLKAVAQPALTMQSMVFEPSTRILYLATGPNAPSRGFEKIDLKPYFANRGS